MKLLVACDAHIYRLKDKFYILTSFADLFDRYLNVFEKVKVVARVKNVNTLDHSKNSELKSLKIEIFPIPFFQGPIQYLRKYFEIDQFIRNSIDDVDRAILRLPSTIGFKLLPFIKNNNIPYSIEVVANPYELSKTTKNLIHSYLYMKMHKSLKKACMTANGVSYVSKIHLPDLYPTSSKAFISFYSSIVLNDNSFYFERKYSKKEIYKIVHVSNSNSFNMKGQIEVFKIAQKLCKLGFKNFVITFVGDSIYDSKYKKISQKYGLSSHVKFVGYLNKDELKKILIESDIMVFPTKSEGLPRVVIEAIATGLPCMSSNVGGLPELLSSDLLFPPSDIDGFTYKILSLVKNNDYFERVVKSNYLKSSEYSAKMLQTVRDSFYQKLKDIE